MREIFKYGSVGRAPDNRCLYLEANCVPPYVVRRIVLAKALDH